MTNWHAGRGSVIPGSNCDAATCAVPGVALGPLSDMAHRDALKPYIEVKHRPKRAPTSPPVLQ